MSDTALALYIIAAIAVIFVVARFFAGLRHTQEVGEWLKRNSRH